MVFLRLIIWFVIAILISGGGDTAATGGIFILFATTTGTVSFTGFKTSEFGITNKRVIIKNWFHPKKFCRSAAQQG